MISFYIVLIRRGLRLHLSNYNRPSLKELLVFVYLCCNKRIIIYLIRKHDDLLTLGLSRTDALVYEMDHGASHRLPF